MMDKDTAFKDSSPKTVQVFPYSYLPSRPRVVIHLDFHSYFFIAYSGSSPTHFRLAVFGQARPEKLLRVITIRFHAAEFMVSSSLRSLIISSHKECVLLQFSAGLCSYYNCLKTIGHKYSEIWIDHLCEYVYLTLKGQLRWATCSKDLKWSELNEGFQIQSLVDKYQRCKEFHHSKELGVLYLTCENIVYILKWTASEKSLLTTVQADDTQAFLGYNAGLGGLGQLLLFTTTGLDVIKPKKGNPSVFVKEKLLEERVNVTAHPFNSPSFIKTVSENNVVFFATKTIWELDTKRQKVISLCDLPEYWSGILYIVVLRGKRYYLIDDIIRSRYAIITTS